MRLLGLTVCLWASLAAAAAAAEAPDYGSLSNQRLVDALTEVSEAAPGAVDLGNFDGFIAEDRALRMQMGIVGAPAPVVPPAMRELVRRGPEALPALIGCLDDARPTRLVVGAPGPDAFPFMWAILSDEYDPRHAKDRGAGGGPMDGRPLPRDGYVVKVADLCFTLIGQIVNRGLTTVRYQPTAGLIVNSPIETPSLRTRVIADWSGLDRGQHRASLLADLVAPATPDLPDRSNEALRRLRFYYPDTYAGLTGADQEARRRFEERERAER